MLKNRLIPVLFLKNGFLIRSESFSIHQKLGNPLTQVERYNSWDVDELIYIDITQDNQYDYNRDDMGRVNPANILDILGMISKKSFMPLTFGGGITSLEDIHQRIIRGADKVTINSQAISQPNFIKEAAQAFGSQAIIVSIDIKKDEYGDYQVYDHKTKKTIELQPQDWARQVESLGAGEIFLNNVDRDGRGIGLDCQIIKKIVDCVKIPVIACGGIGDFNQFKKGYVEGGASAIAAGNIFNFKEFSYQLAKKNLKKNKINVR